MEQGISKTIVITHADAMNMIGACSVNDALSRDFYDWYLKENTFFALTGMLIINDFLDKEQKLCASFNFNDPDFVEFTFYKYEDRRVICNFIFCREDNLKMDDAIFRIKYINKVAFDAVSVRYGFDGVTLKTDELGEKLNNIKQRIGNLPKQKQIRRLNDHKKILLKEIKQTQIDLDRINTSILNQTCKYIIYSTYALMYNMSRQKPEEITTQFNAEYISGDQKVEYIYKYTGYVDLRKNKVYRPLIKKDPNEPTREYQRHIEKWTVRGHYRRTSKGLIWIEPHVKGEGELEKRIYGTEDESSLNIIPKVFTVVKNVSESIDNETLKKEDIGSMSIDDAINIYEDIAEPKPQKKGIIRTIIDTFFSFFTR